MRVGGRLNGVGKEVPESPDQDREDACQDQHGFQAGAWPWRVGFGHVHVATLPERLNSGSEGPPC